MNLGLIEVNGTEVVRYILWSGRVYSATALNAQQLVFSVRWRKQRPRIKVTVPLVAADGVGYRETPVRP